jgi:hypothetical protein
MAVHFRPMPDYAAVAVFTDWSHGLNRTFQTVKRVALPGGDQFK